MIILVIAIGITVLGLVVCYLGLPHKDIPQEIVDVRDQSQRASDGEVY